MRCPDELSEGVVDVDGRCDFVLKHVAVVRQDGGHAGADVIALDKRDLPDADASDIGDGVERPGGAVKRDAKIAGAWFARLFFLNFILTVIVGTDCGSE